MKNILVGSVVLATLLLSDCIGDDNINLSTPKYKNIVNKGHRYDNNSYSRNYTGNTNDYRSYHRGNRYNDKKTLAYFGDKENNLVVVVDVDNMKVLDAISTSHKKTYAAEVIKTRGSHSFGQTPKMYIDNRGSDAIDVLDSQTNNIVKTIELPFYPRSIDIEKRTGLVAVSSTNKPMMAIIDSSTDSIIATVGENVVTYPTTSGHSYVSSGTLACGHPKWLDDNHFALLDRQNKKIITYKIEENSGIWTTTKINEIDTPSPVHTIELPQIHQYRGLYGGYGSRVFYATAEGSTDVYPSILKLEFTPDVGLKIIETLEIKKEGLSPNVMGLHHLDFLKDETTMYVGSDEGNLFVIDTSSSPMKIIKTIKAGKGVGHTAQMKHDINNIAVIINHKDNFITLVNTTTNEKISDIVVSNLSEDEISSVQTQSHPKYHFSEDGRYFYLFLTEEGALVKVDLEEKKVVGRVEIGGKLAMGSFIKIMN